MIALNLSDKDVGNFRLICVSTNDAIDADHDRFWFYRFREHFDPPRCPHANHSQTKQIYQARRHAMNRGMRFIHGYTRQEKAYLQMVKDIIVGKSIASLLFLPYLAMCRHVLCTDLRSRLSLGNLA
jgi:hypothetical protein